MDGILNVNKPSGLTSFAVVAGVKRITGELHTGHAGTLDPIATGVLPICLGQATRVVEYLSDQSKTYRAEIELGVVTDSYDSTGKVLRTGDVSAITRELIQQKLEKFKGTIQQTPPMYSALKHKGQPLYKLARQGIEIERKSRAVRIFSLEIIEWISPLLTLEVTCSKGTYIRSLAYDLGEELGCGANMKNLVRLKVGPFSIEEAATLPQIEDAVKSGVIESLLYPTDYVLTQFPAVLVNREQQCALSHGSTITASHDGLDNSPVPENGILARAYGEDGSFLGLLRFNAEWSLWQPEKILFRECPGCGTRMEVDGGSPGKLI
jgi:tRNA pseudouridine55 synthase